VPVWAAILQDLAGKRQPKVHFTPECLKDLLPTEVVMTPAGEQLQHVGRICRDAKADAWEVYYPGKKPRGSKFVKWTRARPEILALYESVKFLWDGHKPVTAH